MGVPVEHTRLLRQTGFPVPAEADLDPNERLLLERYGHWLEALATEALAPTTPEQQRFVRVARGEAEPQSAFEVAWVKCRRAAQPSKPLVGPLELADRLAQLQAARSAATAAQDEYNARRDAILEQVRPLLDALDAEFADRLTATRDQLALREAQVRDAVLAYGASFQHAGIRAIYSSGRVSWDNRGLSRYMETHPEVEQFRRLGAPYVTLRYPPSGDKGGVSGPDLENGQADQTEPRE